MQLSDISSTFASRKIKFNMEDNMIYVAVAFGGQYEDKWEKAEAAFLTKEKVDEYVAEQMALKNKISDVNYIQIVEYLNTQREKVMEKYFDDSTGEFTDGVDEKIYGEANDKFENESVPALVQERFGIDYEDFKVKEDCMHEEFCDYMIEKIPLFK